MRYTYIQKVADEGYRIDENGHLVTVEKLVHNWHLVNIMDDHKGLFKTFTSITSEEEIVQFANTFGHLGRGVVRRMVTVGSFEYKGLSMPISEDHPLIITGEYETPNTLISLQEYETMEQKGKSGNHYLFPNCESVQFWFQFIDYMKNFCWMFDSSPYKNKPEYKSGVWEIINPLFDNGIAMKVETVNVDESDSDGPALSFVHYAKNLLSALYLQLALHYTGERVIQECSNPNCHSYFEIGGLEGKRRHAKYCSEACKNHYHNAKRPSTLEGRSAIE